MFMQYHFFNPFGRFLHVRPLPCLLMNKWVNRAHIVRIPNQAFVTPNRLSYIKLVYRAVFLLNPSRLLAILIIQNWMNPRNFTHVNQPIFIKSSEAYYLWNNFVNQFISSIHYLIKNLILIFNCKISLESANWGILTLLGYLNFVTYSFSLQYCSRTFYTSIRCMSGVRVEFLYITSIIIFCAQTAIPCIMEMRTIILAVNHP